MNVLNDNFFKENKWRESKTVIHQICETFCLVFISKTAI